MWVAVFLFVSYFSNPKPQTTVKALHGNLEEDTTDVTECFFKGAKSLLHVKPGHF